MEKEAKAQILTFQYFGKDKSAYDHDKYYLHINEPLLETWN